MKKKGDDKIMIMMTMMTKDKYRKKIDEDEGGYEDDGASTYALGNLW